MKRTLVIISIGALIFASAAYANDRWMDDCEAFKAANPEAAADCGCMAEAIGDDEALMAEMIATETLDDVERLSDAAKAIIESC